MADLSDFEGASDDEDGGDMSQSDGGISDVQAGESGDVKAVTSSSIDYRWSCQPINNGRGGIIMSPFFEVFMPTCSAGWHQSSWYIRATYGDSLDRDVDLALCKREDSYKRPDITRINYSFFLLDHLDRTLVARAPYVSASEFANVSEIACTFGKSHVMRCLETGDGVTLYVRVKATIFYDIKEIKPVGFQCPTNTPCSALPHLMSLLNDKNHADFTIKCGNESFSVHKDILTSVSPIFEKMFETDMKEAHSKETTIVDIDPSVVSDLLAFIYTGTAPNIKETAKSLLNAANKYQIPSLFKMCEDNLQSTLVSTNVVEMLVWADLHTASQLKTACLSYIQGNSATVCETEGWKYLKQNHKEHSALLIEVLEFMMH